MLRPVNKLWNRLKTGPLYQIRYLFSFGRHWAVGLPNHVPDLTDPDIRRAHKAGKESLRLHLEHMNSTGEQKTVPTRDELIGGGTLTLRNETETFHVINDAHTTNVDHVHPMG